MVTNRGATMKTVTGLILMPIACMLVSAVSFSADFDTGETFADELSTGGMGPKVVVIPGGIFTLGGGSPGQHDLGVVKLEYRIAFGVTEVTVGQYRQFLQATQSGNPHKSGDADGTSTLDSWGDEVGEERANCLGCTKKFTAELAPVGSFPPNAWGVYDMHGNVWEWTKDCIDPNSAPPANGMPQLFGNCESRELRGGSAKSDGWSIRAGARATALRKTRLSDVGFRVVRELDLSEQ